MTREQVIALIDDRLDRLQALRIKLMEQLEKCNEDISGLVKMRGNSEDIAELQKQMNEKGGTK
jgi:ATP phosphoribosyltransferase regulatory subunit HisZ